MTHTDYFKDKKITVMGLGLLGRGVGDVEFLALHGAELIVTDLKSEEELRTSLERLKNYNTITYVLGEHRLEDFRDRDFILKAAGVPLDNIYIEEAEKNNIAVEMSTALFADLSQATIIGVTGTRGKSTVTHMVFEALQKHNENTQTKRRVFLGGNVRGLSTLALLDEIHEEDIAVLELDSWQLQGFRTRNISPHISVFTTFMPDHMNYYGNDLRAYFYDKSAIYASQKKNDVLIVSENVERFMREFENAAPHSNVHIVRKPLAVEHKLMMPGEHNRLNANLALETLKVCGIDEEEALSLIAGFRGVPGRLEKVAEKEGRVFYNDTTATTPEAATVAIEALADKDIILIAGGSDKGLDFSPLIKAFSKVQRIILLPGAGTDRMVKESGESVLEKVTYAPTMSEAVSEAYSCSGQSDIILLSPGCASFGLFENEFDRGDQFIAAIEKI
ncbi:MAG: UDP-N-acetylmuramoyl-L-alanine--D-glutamate ligase [Candidatus Paceibacterota bacterium]